MRLDEIRLDQIAKWQIKPSYTSKLTGENLCMYFYKKILFSQRRFVHNNKPCFHNVLKKSNKKEERNHK